MKIVVCIKRTPDTETKVRLGADGGSIDPDGVKFIISPYDEFAIEAALQLKEAAGSGEVALLSMGGDDVQETLRQGLAMGADEAVLLKGDPGVDALATAKREFEEETDIEPAGELLNLGWIKQKGGKTVHAWAFEGDYDESRPLRSNTFRIEWPPRSGREQEFPEIDRGAFFDTGTARRKINSAQVELIERLEKRLEESR